MLFFWKKIEVGEFERVLLFREGEFVAVLGPGTHWRYDPLWKLRTYTLSVRKPWIEHSDLDVIARSGALRGQAEVLDLKDHERAVVMIDGRFARLLRPGLVTRREDNAVTDADQEPTPARGKTRWWQRGKVDYVGAALLAAALAGITIGLGTGTQTVQSADPAAGSAVNLPWL